MNGLLICFFIKGTKGSFKIFKDREMYNSLNKPLSTGYLNQPPFMKKKKFFIQVLSQVGPMLHSIFTSRLLKIGSLAKIKAE